MLLTLTTTRSPATDLGYLLHKHPERVQRFGLSFGTAHVCYPEASAERCTACLLVDVDPVDLVRSKPHGGAGLLDQYVNDRPYAASSFLSVAIGQVFSSALQGRCSARPELAAEALPLTARLPVVPVRGEAALVHALFEPLGYAVSLTRHPLDERYPDWGESPYCTLALSATVTVRELLSHLYVLLPVLDNAKHYWVGEDEVDKLLRHGGDWLAAHPEQPRIVRRYLRHQWSLAREALARLEVVEEEAEEPGERLSVAGTAASADEMPAPERASATGPEDALEAPLSLNEARIAAIVGELTAAGVDSVADLGCGEGTLLSRLLRDTRIPRLVGVDVSARALEIATTHLRLERLPERQRARVTLLLGALTYRDARLEGFDAATVIEVIEHLDAERLSAFERVLFACAKPRLALVTTPNVEYNVKYETLPAGKLRHPDHRFEWTRAEFRAWAGRVAECFGYAVRFEAVGEADADLGPPTQMAVFTRIDAEQGVAV